MSRTATAATLARIGELEQMSRALARIEARTLRHLEFMAARYPGNAYFQRRLDDAWARRGLPRAKP